MTRRQLIIVGWVAAGVVVALFALVCWRKREALRDKIPAWLDNHQPPETITPEMMTVSPVESLAVESLAANRCRPFAASCLDFTAGRRTRRTYHESLESDPGSVVRARLEIGGGF
jgi:hypothetical protein